MEKKTIEQGKAYIEERVRIGVSEKGSEIHSFVWRITHHGDFELLAHSRDRIADKKFTRDELELFEVDNQFKVRVEAKILSLALKLA